MRSTRSLLVYLAAACLVLAAVPSSALAQEAAPGSRLRATRLSIPPVIDGRLDDDAWSASPLPIGEWKSYNPLHGDTIPQRTSVWVGYDSGALYFAFRCED